MEQTLEKKIKGIVVNPHTNWEEKAEALSALLEQERKKAAIEFGKWYSGMEEQKVKKAYERYENEVLEV